LAQALVHGLNRDGDASADQTTRTFPAATRRARRPARLAARARTRQVRLRLALLVELVRPRQPRRRQHLDPAQRTQDRIRESHQPGRAAPPGAALRPTPGPIDALGCPVHTDATHTPGTLAAATASRDRRRTP